MSTILFVLTFQYPFAPNESPFVTPELVFLEKAFDQVYLVPLQKAQDEAIAIPDGIKILDIPNLRGPVKRDLFGKLKDIIAVRKDVKRRGKNLSFSEIKYFATLIGMNRNKGKILASTLEGFLPAEISVYSYWADSWPYAMEPCRPLVKTMILRAHGYDLYENRRKNNYIPLRSAYFKIFDHLICISKQGENYLKNLLPELEEKISCSYLGSTDLGEGPINSSKTKVILSCSRIENVKRVHLIPKLLAKCEEPIEWIHIGDGAKMELVKSEIAKLPNNIKVRLEGSMMGPEVLNFMKRNAVDAFINVSESEGLPVSIMEALSFGIPVLATDVGGTCEIVNEYTGLLLHKDFTSEQGASALISLLNSSLNTPENRREIRKFWSTNLSAETNFTKFANQLSTGKF